MNTVAKCEVLADFFVTADDGTGRIEERLKMFRHVILVCRNAPSSSVEQADADQFARGKDRANRLDELVMLEQRYSRAFVCVNEELNYSHSRTFALGNSHIYSHTYK